MTQDAEDTPRRLRSPVGQYTSDALAPLAPFAGARPPAPAWFDEAIAQTPETQHVCSHQTHIELLTWGQRGRPGLLLVHGAGGHAHWWDWTAPFLADRFRVAAISLPGCGGSQWRDRYSSADFSDDALACAHAAGLWDAGPPVCVGHSMGGAHLFHGAVHNPERMRGLVLVDTSFREIAHEPPEAMHNSSARPERIYDSEAAAVSRFRLMPPPQSVREPALVDYIARQGLRQTTGQDGRSGWTWRHDPGMWRKLERGLEQGPFPDGPTRIRIPAVHVMGDRSHVVLHPSSSPLAPEVPRIVIPDCGHHVMVDQPIAFVAVLRTLLTFWPGSPSGRILSIISPDAGLRAP